jgi:hypothetical protein
MISATENIVLSEDISPQYLKLMQD